MSWGTSAVVKRTRLRYLSVLCTSKVCASIISFHLLMSLPNLQYGLMTVFTLESFYEDRGVILKPLEESLAQGTISSGVCYCHSIVWWRPFRRLKPSDFILEGVGTGVSFVVGEAGWVWVARARWQRLLGKAVST